MASNIVDDPLETSLLKAATECQQNFYEICADFNLYERKQHGYLKSFIGYALYGAPELVKNDEKDETNEFNVNNYYLYDEKKDKSIGLIYDKVIEYGKCEKSNGIVLCGIIYNVIYNKEAFIKCAQKKVSADKSKDDDDNNGNTCVDNSNKDATTPLNNSDDEKPNETINSQPEPQVYPVPVFKVRQYFSEKMEKDGEVRKKSNSSSSSNEKPEIIYYIDNAGRAYNGFEDYLESNTLPQCTMVFPKDGKYQMNPADESLKIVRNNVDGFMEKECPSYPYTTSTNGNVVTKVWLEIRESPASNVAMKVLTGGDIASTIVTIASMGVGIAAMLTPVGAGVALAGAVGAGVSGLWQAGRCAQQLADRGQHGESINVTDKDALGAWIGIAGGTMGLAATGGGALLARAVRTGTSVGRVAIVAYDVVIIGNLVINGVGVGFKGYDMYATYADGGKITAQDVLFLTTHLLFFCNSIINIRLTQSFVETSQGQLLKDYEASLRSNRHRKEFQRMARNTRAAGINDISSNEEIIRGINKINNKDEFFQAMVRNRKSFSSSGARAAFSSDGKVIVNSIMTIDPIEFANLPKDIRVDIVKGVSSVQINNNNNLPSITKDQPLNIIKNEVSYKNFTANNNAILKEFCLKHSNAMMQMANPKIADFGNVLSDLRNCQSSAQIFIKLLDTAYKILQAMPRDEVIRLGNIFSSIVQFIWDYVKMNLRYARPGLMVDDPSANIVLDKLVQELWICVEKKVDEWVQAFRKWLEDKYPHSINEYTSNWSNS